VPGDDLCFLETEAGEEVKINDAKQKWCPFSSTLSNNYTNSSTAAPGTIQVVMPAQGLPFNRPNDQYSALPDGCKCLADKCMAWRTMLNDPDDGHCGLAGFQQHGG